MRALPLSGIAGSVWLLSLLSYSVLADSGWPVGEALPLDLRENFLREHSPVGLGWVYLLSFFAPAFVVLLWNSTEVIFRIDPRKISIAAIKWALPVVLSPPVLVPIGLSIVFIVLAVQSEPPLFWAFTAIGLTCYLLLPLWIYQPDVVGISGRSKRWLPAWPGVAPLITALLCIVIVIGAGEAIGGLVSGSSVAPALLGTTLSAPLKAAVPPIVAAALVFRLGPGEAVAKAKLLRVWPTIGPFVALQARLGYLLLLIAPVALAIWMLLWVQLPTGAAWYASEGLSVPWPTRTFVGAMNIVASYWLYVAAALAVPAEQLMVGRMVWLIAADESSDHLAAAA